MSLDLVVSQSILRIRALERALHDQGPWFIEPNGCGVPIPAQRTVHADRVVFTAQMSTHGQEHMDLVLCAGPTYTPVLHRTIELPPDTPRFFEMDWSLGVRDAVAA